MALEHIHVYYTEQTFFRKAEGTAFNIRYYSHADNKIMNM